MKSNKTVIYLCALYLLLEVIHFFVYAFEATHTPELLHEYKSFQYSNLPSWWEHIPFLTLVLLAARIASLVGIIFSKNWARYLFVVSIAIPILLHLFLGYFIVGPFSGFTVVLINILAGIIIGIVFFSETKHTFK